MVVFKKQITNDLFQLLVSLEVEGHLCAHVSERQRRLTGLKTRPWFVYYN